MKYEKDFPIFKTKVAGVDKKFNLSDAVERREYFNAKCREDVEKLKAFFDNGNTFVAYLLGKKNSGKGTYTKLMMELFGKDKITHISVGDVVRAAHKELEDESKKGELVAYLEKNYRGYIPLDDAINAILGRDTKTLVPTEIILALVKREIDKLGKKTLFIDGLPRSLDQISYALFFRDLINYRQDPDVFVAIDIPESVINERMRTRVICPNCQTPRTTKLFVTKEVGYDKEKKQFFLKCDDAACGGARMVGKEGDDAGIESIRERLNLDQTLVDKVFTLQGVPKVLLRNAIPVSMASENIDEYEITPEYYFEHDEATDKVTVHEKPFAVKDDEGVESYSLLAPPVAMSLVKQLVKVLGL